MVSPDPSIYRYDPRKRGLARWLGPLETRIMAAVWERAAIGHRSVTVKMIHHDLGARESAYTTILTTMSRMAEKGLLRRAKRGLSHDYTPVDADEDAFIARQTRAVLASLEQAVPS